MKKSLFILTFVVISFPILSQQGIYYKTLYLQDKYNVVTKKIRLTPEVGAVLKDFFITVDVARLDSNPYLKDMFADAVGASSIPFGGFNSASISGIDVTKLADGLAQFVVERTKQELSANFFEKFKEDLNKKELNDLKILFPETWKTLNTIGEDIYQYTAYLNSLRGAFIKDLDNEYANLRKLLEQQKYKDYFATHPELGTILYSGLYFTEKISKGMHPGEALKNFDLSTIRLCPAVGCDTKTKNLETNIKNSLQLLQMLSSSFRSVTKENYWVPLDSVRMLLDDEVGFKLYMGLFYQVSKGITFKKEDNSNLTVETILRASAGVQSDLDQYKYYIENFNNKTQVISERVSDLKDKKKTDIQPEEYYQLFNASLDLLDHAHTFIELPHVDMEVTMEAEFKRVSENILFLGKTSGQLFLDVRSKNYSSAIVNSIVILDTVLNFNNSFNITQIESVMKINKSAIMSSSLSKSSKKNILSAYSSEVAMKLFVSGTSEDNILKELTAATKAEVTGNAATKAALIKYVRSQVDKVTAENKGEIRGKILKYGSLMASVAAAQSGEEVKKAIESIALPAGSSRIKRESKFNVSLNAYCGLFLGSEKRQYKIEEEGAAINAFGLTVPVGIAVNWGSTLRRKAPHCSHSIFISMLDIGAIAAYRFKSDTVQTISKVQLGDIFSPGLFYSFGIPKSPLSFNLGYQASPLLRNVNETGNAIKSVYHRFSISLLVDIPLLNFYTSPRKK